MATRMTKAWMSVDEAKAKLRGHMGVFQLANAEQDIIYIGYAGGSHPQGMRGAVIDGLALAPDAMHVRVEINTAYLSRWRELMMAFIADFDVPPKHNPPVKLGTLSPN